MKEIYLLILEYKSIHPIRFWGGIFLFLSSIIFLIKFQNKKKKRQNKVLQKEEKTQKNIRYKNENIERFKPKPKKITLAIPENKEEKVYKNILPPEIKELKQVKPLSKKKTIENLPKAIVESDKKINKNKFVNYTSTISDNEDSYPILKTPSKNCIVRTHRYGATKRKGFKDQSFEKSISTFFSNKYEVSGNVRLNTGKSTRPFEPDIAIICTTNKNIRIDIEIDEPYAGITRQSIHCKGEDVNRDNYFRDRGWIVIRFSEYQVHTKEIECLNFIALVISSIDNSFQIPNNLQAVSKIQNEVLWDIVQAQKWEKENYRENYLNHTFSKLTEHKGTTKRDFDKREEEEEKLVKPTSLGSNDKGKNIGFNKTNTNKRDKRIKFDSEEHNYTIDGVPAPSVTTIISRFFPEFDAVGKASNLSSRNPLYGLPVNDIVEIWKDRGIEAANKGTFLHEQIENYYLQQPYEETEEFYQFLNFVKDHNHLKPYRSEWRIFDETHNIAGTIDLLVENDNGSFDIYDWKRSKKVISPFNNQVIKNDRWGNIGIGILQHIDDTSYNKYELQQNLYRQILEEKYGIKINNMYLIVMHTDEGYTNYHKVRVPHLTNEINSILQTV
ncbi:hypothetical protein [Tenacibaculum finnmarkense]|uniref:hypothetical protein n=1 Tax=Tenacibaculum finnmarkense TaxID=2781243 RepID=UPI001EFB9F80|nr:hypothetical protein [Tenacibaculum finnmarkense]MCG8734681.1 hypothetical protein [Tenacibaculum finnmarkense]MCG8859998.1 hypothetical protein [Tenacibaculum finnmarkense]WCC41499.1 hypothetical protein PJJ26_08360 [Tenacibaculum finnmarkense]